MATTNFQGLTAAEVAQRTTAGQVNTAMAPLTRPISQIIRSNTFTLFNLVNVVLGALIFTTGSYSNLLFLGVAIVNTAIGTFQEIRAKRELDALAIVSQAKAHVWRDGTLSAIAPDTIVLDDIVQLQRGDQVMVDGVVVTDSAVEIDESPLTGESNAISKAPGEQLLSGSFVVAGTTQMRVTHVSSDTFAAKLALEAKAEKVGTSQLLATINRIIQILTWILIPIGVLLFTISMVRRGAYNRAILTTSAAVIGMIPEGLVLLTNVALAVSSMHLGRKRVLVRSLTAIEALARVDTLCLDKTGTITSGKLNVQAVTPAARHTKQDVLAIASAVVYALNDDNETAMAIKHHVPQQPTWSCTDTVPFSSARKWSGASFSDGAHYFIGAPEFTFGESFPADMNAAVQAAAEKGLRVIVVGRATKLQPQLSNPELIGIITIADELRPSAIDTLSFFAKQDVNLKVISGDNPVTVAQVARAAQIPGANNYINMSTVADDADYAALMRENTVFGRVTPQQKKRLIANHQQAGHTVAMTGDGVNDVLAMRQADCSVAMASGADAASAIADFVLLDSNFDAMTGVLNEGRRVINNIESAASLYLIKTMYSVILATIFIFLNMDYPIVPIYLTPVTAVAIAMPSFFLTLEPNFARVTGQFLKKVMTFAAPAALAIVIYTLVLTFLQYLWHLPFKTAGTMVVLLIGCISYNVLFRVCRPFNRYKLGMVILVGIALFGVFFVINPAFSLATLWDWRLFLIYAPLAGSSIPVYLLLQEFLGRRLLAKIRWRH